METADILLELSRSDLSDLAGAAAASITDVKQHSSYNWIEAESPTIAIPGCPPAWSDITTPRRLAKDSGRFYIAQNQARHPDSPLEPLFRSLYQTEPTFDIRSVDIVSDRNNFRKLLSFIEPVSDPHGADSFAIKVEVVADTALFDRDEAAAEETIGPAEFRGYGRTFEKLCTKNEIQNSTGHHRIISYRFGDLGIVIRHETNAYIAVEAREAIQGEELAQIVSQMTLSTGEGASNRHQPAGSAITLVTQGRSVSREATVEIKTRSKWNPLAIKDVAPQLWISQTPKLVRSHHDKGLFPASKVEDVTGEIKQWEEDQQDKLKILAAVLRKIRDVVRTCSSHKAIVRYDKAKDRLTVVTGGNKDMLPEDLYRRWDARHDSGRDEGYKQSDTSKGLDDKPTTRSSERPSIVIGNTTYESLPLPKLPALASWFANERAMSPEKSTFKHEMIPLFPVVLTAVRSGWRHIFRSPGMADVYQLKTLCSSFATLGVDVLEGKALDQVCIDIKAGKYSDEWDAAHNVNMSLARNAAFQLVCLLLQDQEGTQSDGNKPDPKRANQFYNATLYIAGHLRTFKYKTRRAVQAVYLHCQSPSVKQWNELTKWSSDRDADESDATTSDEPELYDDGFGFDDEYDS